jgi:aminopeptidase S
VALLLELARAFRRLGLEPQATIRFAFWGAEELGLWGSAHYVASLGRRVHEVAGYLNFDTVSSRNPVRFVYDAPLERLVRTPFRDAGLASEEVNL